VSCSPIQRCIFKSNPGFLRCFYGSYCVKHFRKTHSLCRVAELKNFSSEVLIYILMFFLYTTMLFWQLCKVSNNTFNYLPVCRVLHSFLLFLTWYSLFILAFGLSFYILLHKDNGQVISPAHVVFLSFLPFGSLPSSFSVFTKGNRLIVLKVEPIQRQITFA
jgi:hypothetical protein